MRRVAVLTEAFDPEREAAAFRAGLPEAGAVVSFVGQVRGRSEAGAVTGLHLQHAPGFTEERMGAIAAEAEARWPLAGLLVLHRAGDMAPGEPIVLVAAASRHRRAAFEAADFLMDYLKSEAPFWKKERRAGGDVWIEPRAEDYSDKARWSA